MIHALSATGRNAGTPKRPLDSGEQTCEPARGPSNTPERLRDKAAPRRLPLSTRARGVAFYKRASGAARQAVRFREA